MMGDFNLYHSFNHNTNYNYNICFEELNEITLALNLKQIVNFPAWSRVVSGNLKESILNHIYIHDTTLMTDLSSFNPEITIN